jgi:hypothetical protein
LSASQEIDVFGTGVIEFIDLEGGFFGIISDDGKRYDPANLPEELKIPGIRVEFEARTQPKSIGFHMWGRKIEILSIERIDP